MRGYDAWVTREPPYMDYEPPPPLKCGRCGCFLVREPYGKREWMSIRHCSGNATVLTCTYDAEADAGILAIIGDEYAGRTYEVAYPPECGGRGEPERLLHWDGDIRPEDAASYRHDPHFFEDEPMSPFMSEIRVCGHCGHYNEEPIL